mmetsp:Transcript_26771/g.68188  ORF Transcript_26771/g.68188 Transcript_26771/m.68188 type:complete len:260 (-) Transcript_26771:1-780(-)
MAAPLSPRPKSAVLLLRLRRYAPHCRLQLLKHLLRLQVLNHQELLPPARAPMQLQLRQARAQRLGHHLQHLRLHSLGHRHVGGDVDAHVVCGDLDECGAVHAVLNLQPHLGAPAGLVRADAGRHQHLGAHDDGLIHVRRHRVTQHVDELALLLTPVCHREGAHIEPVLALNVPIVPLYELDSPISCIQLHSVFLSVNNAGTICPSPWKLLYVRINRKCMLPCVFAVVDKETLLASGRSVFTCERKGGTLWHRGLMPPKS